MPDNFGVDRNTGTGGTGAPGTTDSSLVVFLPAGDGGIEETVEDALQRIVFDGQYDTEAHYEAARDALVDTAGLCNLQITGTLEVDGVNVVTSLQAFAIAMAIAL